MIDSTKTGKQFINDFIPRVSRTFALTIKFLPRGLRDSVFVSYLLCRVADTLEDSPYLDSDQKRIRLSRLSEILEKAAGGELVLKEDIAFLYESIDADSGDDHRLLGETSKLFDILESLPENHRPIIYRWAGEMAKGMAEFVGLYQLGGEAIVALKNIEDWDRYCYYVAGTVGHMMTELFIQHYNFNDDRAARLTALGNSFGLGLQKVNVIKDVPDDRERGVCYLPLSIMNKYGLDPSSLSNVNDSKADAFIRELAEKTLNHLDDALTYTTLIPNGHKGVRMFLIVPVLLALETMRLIVENPGRSMTGPAVKISRSDVSGLVAAAAFRVTSNKSLEKQYGKLRAKIG
ncbi:MAG: phytoene/squalene synthase family protein [candidate division Zixibacteria bacterium]